MMADVRPANPFPGLRPFEAKDATLFFGRDDQTGEALERLLRQRLLAVVGVSGCGKSSLVGAGMVPAVEMGLAGDAEQRWRVATMRPGDGPLRELERCLDFGGAALAQRTYGLLEAVETHLPEDENLLLVVDQFEEIFPFRDRKLRQGGGSEADLFVSYLLRAAQEPGGRVYVLLTMRSDYLGECAKFHGLPEALNDGQYLVPRMTRRQLQEAMEGPLQAAGVEIHPALVQDLLNQCDEEPDNLPLLQHLLRRMFEQWEADGGQGPITAAMAEKVGGLGKALDGDADKVYGELKEKGVAEALFRRITEWRRAEREDEDRPIRRAQTVADLVKLTGVPGKNLRGLVACFEERGLLVVRKTDQGDKVDLPHECMCLKWGKLKEWIKAEAEDAKSLRFLLDAVGKSYLTGSALSEAVKWQKSGRFDSEWCLRYLSGERREGVVAWVAESQGLMEAAAEKERARQEEKRVEAEERSRRARKTAAVLGAVAVVASYVGWYAYVKKVEADQLRGDAWRSELHQMDLRWDAQDQKVKADGLAASEQKQRQTAEEQRHLADRARGEAVRLAASATSGRMAASALLKIEPRLDLAALLSVEGLRISDTLEARSALLTSLQANPGLTAILRHKAGVSGVAFSPDDKVLATAGGDGMVTFWDIGTRRLIGPGFKGHGNGVNSVAFSPDGKLLVSTGDNRVKVWVGGDWRPLGGAEWGSYTSIISAVFSPDKRTLAWAGADNEVTVVDLATPRSARGFKGHSGWVLGVAFSPDGRSVASASMDETVRVWDVNSGQPVGEPLKGHYGYVRSVAFSADGRTLASAGDDHTVRLWDVATHQAVGRLTGHTGGVYCVAFRPDGKVLASAGTDRSVRLWDVAAGQPLGDPLKGHSDTVTDVGFSHDGRMLASASRDGTVRLWDPANRQALAGSLEGQRDRVQAVVFSPDGKTLVSTDDKAVRLWDVASRRPRAEQLKGAGTANRIAVSPDGRRLALLKGFDTVELWDIGTGQRVGSPQQGGYIMSGVTFSNHGKVITTVAADAEVQRWEAVSGRALGKPADRPYPPHVSVETVAFGGDGRVAAIAFVGGQVKMWDTQSQRSTGDPLKNSERVLNVALSPTGATLSTAMDDGTIQLWDVASQRKLGDPLKGTASSIWAMAFSPDGRALASGGTGVQLWDVASRQPLGPALSASDRLSGALDAAVSVAFSADGKLLAAVDDNGQVRLWDVDPKSWAVRACRVANRNLSVEEWRQFIGLDVPYRRTCPEFPAGEGVAGK